MSNVTGIMSLGCLMSLSFQGDKVYCQGNLSENAIIPKSNEQFPVLDFSWV